MHQCARVGLTVGLIRHWLYYGDISDRAVAECHFWTEREGMKMGPPREPVERVRVDG